VKAYQTFFLENRFIRKVSEGRTYFFYYEGEAKKGGSSDSFGEGICKGALPNMLLFYITHFL
jgi:hypothetical protein